MIKDICAMVAYGLFLAGCGYWIPIAVSMGWL